jgi:hypothetical protein
MDTHLVPGQVPEHARSRAAVARKTLPRLPTSMPKLLVTIAAATANP